MEQKDGGGWNYDVERDTKFCGGGVIQSVAAPLRTEGIFNRRPREKTRSTEARDIMERERVAFNFDKGANSSPVKFLRDVIRWNINTSKELFFTRFCDGKTFRSVLSLNISRREFKFIIRSATIFFTFIRYLFRRGNFKRSLILEPQVSIIYNCTADWIQTINIPFYELNQVKHGKKKKDLKFSNSRVLYNNPNPPIFLHRGIVENPSNICFHLFPTFHTSSRLSKSIGRNTGEKRDAADYPETRKIERQLAENPGRDSAVRGTRSIVFPRGRCKYEAGPNYGAVYGQLIVGFSTVRHGPRTCIRMQNRYSSCRPRLNIPIRAPSPAIATKSRFEEIFLNVFVSFPRWTLGKIRWTN